MVYETENRAAPIPRQTMTSFQTKQKQTEQWIFYNLTKNPIQNKKSTEATQDDGVALLILVSFTKTLEFLWANVNSFLLKAGNNGINGNPQEC